MRTDRRIDEGDDDGRLFDLIRVAREFCENKNETLLTTGTVVETRDVTNTKQLPLTLGPVSAISSVTIDGTALAAETYALTLPDCVTLTAEQTGRAVVTYTAGLLPCDVPAIYKQAMLLIAGHYYENREPVVVGTIVSTLPLGVEHLLDLAGQAPEIAGLS